MVVIGRWPRVISEGVILPDSFDYSSMSGAKVSSFELTIRPRKGWQPVDWKEIFLYRELLAFLMWRDIKIRYRQTLLGGLWAVLQPLIAMLIFTFVFNRLAGVKSDGPPYPLFAFAGLVPWTFFSTALSQSSNSLVANQQLVSKVYFPRVFIPRAQSELCCSTGL